MGLKCSICAHKNRLSIDKAVIEGRSVRDVARQFGVGRCSLDRHRPHIATLVRKNDARHLRQHEARQVRQSRTLASILETSHADLDEAKEMAKAADEGGTLVKVVQARAKLAEVEFGTKGKLDVTVLDMPDEELIPKAIEFLELRGYKVNRY
jgi:hypothetical protein